MKNFLNTFRLAITPITPVYIGCNDDYEPTNYLIRQGWLHSFDPAEVILNGQHRNRLSELGERGNLLSIQRFFRDNQDIFIAATKRVLPVTKEFDRLYKSRLGTAAKIEKNDTKVINELKIERTIYHPYTNMAYLPGSSIKGAIRTAILDRLNTPPLPERNEPKLECSLLGMTDGDFSQSPFRSLKISDFQPVSLSLTQVLAAKQFKKRRIIDKQTGKAIEGGRISTYKEVILPAQYRCFYGDVQIGTETLKSCRSNVISDITGIAKDCNRYYLPQFKQELNLLRERNLISSEWINNIKTLFSSSGEIGKLLETNKVFLLRLGMYGGAESKTYRSDNVAQIKISQGKGKNPKYQDTTTTIWLASINDELLHRQPFGWCLLEISPEKELMSLKQWGEQQIEHFPDEKDVVRLIEVERRKMLLIKQRKQEEKAEIEKRRQEEEAVKNAREAKLATMSEIEREIEEFKTLLNNVKKGAVGSQEFVLCREKLEHICSTWKDISERNQLRDAIHPILKQKDLTGNKKIKLLLQQLKDPL